MSSEHRLLTRKFDGLPQWTHHLWDLRRTDSLFTGRVRRGDTCGSSTGPFVVPSDTTVWAWTDRWYTVAHNIPPWHRGEAYYVNVGTPVEWDGVDLRTIDLDLDVAIYADRAVRVLDQDEFAASRKRYGYPPDVVAAAEAAAAEALDLIGRREFPFDGLPGDMGPVNGR
jgi:protein associated with RNAse G/E